MGIKTVRQRAALTPRREPYWEAMGTGQHIGYRRTDDGGTWIARAYDAATQKRTYQAIGDLSHVAGADQFTEAAKAAREWFDHIGKGGQTATLTVRDACTRYVAHLRRHKGEASATDAEGRIKRHVEGDPIAAVELSKLKAVNVEAWRDRLTDKPATLPRRGPNCRNAEPQQQRPRSKSAINRDMATLRAALNLAHVDGYTSTDVAWKGKLRPIKNADKRRDLYLDREQRRALLEAMPEDVRPFVLGLCLLPLRPGALAALTVGDFNAKAGTLTIGTDKQGEGRKILLPAATASVLRDTAKGKHPAAPLFSRWDGRPWDRQSWKGPIKRAAVAAGLPDGLSAYTLRHCAITDLVTNGLDLFSVAAMSGTSVSMIEKFYGHLQQQRAQEALEGLAL